MSRTQLKIDLASCTRDPNHATTQTQTKIIFGSTNPGSVMSGGMEMPADRTAPVRATAPRRIGGSRFHGRRVDDLELLPREVREVEPTRKRPLLLADDADPICEPPEIPHFKLRPEHRPPVQIRHRYFYGTKNGECKFDRSAQREASLYPLSNFYRGAPFTLDGKRFATSEHYYQWCKFFAVDPIYAELIRLAPTPADCKELGSTKTKQMRADWEAVRVECMRRAVHAKFSQNADIRAKLLDTGNDALHEDAPLDRVWGVCGSDLLGRLLIEERTLLRGVPTDQ